MNVIAGDIGGTKTVIGLFRVEGRALQRRVVDTYASVAHGGLAAIVGDFAHRHGLAPCAGAFGIAGPVVGNRARATNLPWVVDGAELTRTTNLKAVHLMNDLEATALGVFELGPGDFLTLQEGAPAPGGNAAVIAAGTGLGEAGVVFVDGLPHPFASEGGHGGLAPETALERRLLEFLATRLGRVSWERVLSGPALPRLLEFVIADRGETPSPVARTALSTGDPAAVTAGADRHGCPQCRAAFDLFARLYGSEAGNLALTVLATGGVYLGGGIAPRIAAHLQGPAFLEGFLGKGRMRPLLERMPVRLVLDSGAALLGAARRAADTAQVAAGCSGSRNSH